MTAKTFWAGKKVLVTGQTGFKGAWLCLMLNRLGAELSGYALEPPTEPSLYDLAHLAGRMNSAIGDLRDYPRLLGHVEETRPEVVIHMAAQSLVRRSYHDPVGTYATNVMGTVHLLEALRQVGSARVALIVTSDKCYENREWVWGYRESDPMGGYDPYSSSKGCAEIVTAAYRRSFFGNPAAGAAGTAVASARAGNVIGGGDWAEDRLVPDCMRAFLAERPVLIRNPHSLRPWQHVLEPLSGYLLLAEKLWEAGAEFAQAWNFGPDERDVRPVSWIADTLVHDWGGGARWELEEGEPPHEARMLRLDTSLARERLGWQPRTDLRLGLEMTVEWYRGYQRGDAAEAITLRQIEQFENLFQAGP
ncbi:MAG: CDP-glucose 4,6-dehydratase [SAR324 cluster bacterium]|nr:CDP-glucose 4,6-dehydratase [SAR324 cluster bacterium]